MDITPHLGVKAEGNRFEMRGRRDLTTHSTGLAISNSFINFVNGSPVNSGVSSYLIFPVINIEWAVFYLERLFLRGPKDEQDLYRSCSIYSLLI
jgi:hypothetical protein